MSSDKEKFEKERERTLAALPDSIKAAFGEMGFYTDADDIAIPVLVMSPYDVPPTPVRDIYWFDYFGRAKRAKSLDKLAYLVYHYGSNDPDDCYSFVEQDDFISFEDGKKKGYDVLPEGLEGKENLTDEEKIRVRAVKEIEQDLQKEAGDRKRGVTDFLERHEKKQAAAKDPPTKPPAKRQKTGSSS